MFCCCAETQQDEMKVVNAMPSSAGLPVDDNIEAGAKESTAEPPPPPPKESAPSPPAKEEASPAQAEAAPAKMGAAPAKASTSDFKITVEKSGAGSRIGLDTVARKTPPALKIKKVKPGLVSEWNVAHPEYEVKQEDLILEVNGECSDVEKMYNAIAENSKLTLLISRR
mmetsp:Transcript_2528/g.6375  ORF Transcript_2528/g.6375 Transcript_2528/m.6375 type:complete len:169 (+) Transcript_2528:122-628(+)